MDFNITMDKYDFGRKTMRWLIEELPVVSKAMKEAASLMYDSSRLQYSDYGDFFSVMFHQEGGRKGSPNYTNDSKFSGFKIVGVSKWDPKMDMFNVFTLSMWNRNGGTSLLNKTFVCDMDSPLPRDIAKLMETAAKEYVKGIVHCSHCKAELQKDEVAGRYFAGVYCSECWEHTYKAREAKETYN